MQRAMRTRSALIMTAVALGAIFCAALLPARATRAAQHDQSDASAIRAVLDMQVAAWNRGDIPTFMTSYWKSDKTEFVGASGVFRGWQAVLDRYKRAYPDRKTMGQVHFSDLEIHVTSPATAFAVGQYHLQRQSGPVSGIFTLEFRKFPDGWKIIVDHTTAFAQPPAKAKAAH